MAGYLFPRSYFSDETRHKTIGDGGAYPYLGEQIVGVLVDRLLVDVVVVECSYEHIDDADGPQVVLGIAAPVLACIEVCEHAE